MAQVESFTQGGIEITWGATHRSKDGELISRQASIKEPDAPKCLRPNCLIKYFWDSLLFVLVANYHARRVAYAEASVTFTMIDGVRTRSINPILERYRTGEPSPQTIWQAIHANIKITCPVCRKHNVDPLLFKGGNHEKGTGHGSGKENQKHQR